LTQKQTPAGLGGKIDPFFLRHSKRRRKKKGVRFYTRAISGHITGKLGDPTFTRTAATAAQEKKSRRSASACNGRTKKGLTKGIEEGEKVITIAQTDATWVVHAAVQGALGKRGSGRQASTLGSIVARLRPGKMR